MTPTHTPGPWTVESLDNVDFTVLGGKSGQVRVAVESSERDARLIAAAPDLLDALRDLLDDLQMDMLTAPAGSFRMIKSGRRIEQARAAIARATVE